MPHIALLGPPTLLDRCAPSGVADLAVTRIANPPLAGAITTAGPDAIVAFEPSPEELAVLREIYLPTLLWWRDEPPNGSGGPGESGVSDQRRIVAGDADAGSSIWRSVALPVADDLFADAPARTAGDTAIAVNVQDDDGPASMHRALVALARGQLLVSEPLQPSRGLEPGIDYLEVRDLDEVRPAVENAVRAPEAFLRMRLRGRRKAELFRSSRVVARLVGDLLLELDPAAAAR